MQYTQDALARAKNVKMLILDVDGVLTDGSIPLAIMVNYLKLLM